MSGIEVIVGVCGAVSAIVGIFKKSHTFYRNWKAAKAKRRLRTFTHDRGDRHTT